ncbi:hypothetical protein [Streptomyces sp. NPDC021224]|uniref:hypothetical protein n=1 Tax=unclassified Streptomyces TaxID=2593676 RepID=UPI0037B23F13
MDMRGAVPSPVGGEPPPGDVLPVGVPGGGVALRTGAVAVWVGSVRAFPNGFDFAVRVVRGPGRPRPTWHEPRPDAVRVAVSYPDGGVHRSPLHGRPAEFGRSDLGPRTLMELGGSGNNALWESRYWVHPLPPDGPVTVTVGEPGEPGGSIDLSGAAIRAAAAECEQLWPGTDFDEGEGGGTWATLFTR